MKLRIRFTCFILSLLVMPFLNGQEKNGRVLLLNSYHRGNDWCDEVTTGAELYLQKYNIEMHVEYMDTKRDFSSSYMELLTPFYKEKYADTEFDVVITADNNAFNFYRTWKDEIFKGAPHVFCGYNFLKPSHLEGMTGLTGISENANVKDNLSLIKRLHPETKKIIVVIDNTVSGKLVQDEIRLMQTNGDYGVDLELLYDVNGEELSREVSGYGEGTVVLMAFFFIDREGKSYLSDEFSSLVSRAASVPVYGLWSFSLGHGIVGGYLIDGYDQGERAASMARAIMKGTPPDEIPVEYETSFAPKFDYRELERFNIDPVNLPHGSEILYLPQNFLRRYGRIIAIVSIVFFFLLAVIFILFMNIQTRKKSQEALKRSQNKLQTTMASMGEALISTDQEGRIVQINRAAETLTGWTGDQAENELVSRVLQFADKGDDPLPHPVSRVLEEGLGSLTGREVIAVSRDGEKHTLSFSCAPIISSRGEREGAVIVFYDMAEELEMRERISHMEKLETLGQLAGGITHDFNNLMGGIIGAAHLIKPNLKGKGESEEYLDLIIDTAGKAAGLTRELLVFSRRKERKSEEFDLNMEIINTVNLLQHTLDRRIDIVTELNESGCPIKGDSSLIQNVLMNLGINASHAMAEGGKLTIKTVLTDLDGKTCTSNLLHSFGLTPGPYVRLSVSDTGEGIAPEHIKNIFDPFFTTKEEGRGTGLGLAAVFKTVQWHKGAVYVESREGKGTDFTLYFPLLPSFEIEAVHQEERPLTGSGRILIIDDEPLMRQAASGILTELGYETVEAADGREGLKYFVQHYKEIDLVLLDMIMPVMNGRDCFKEIIKIKEDTKIILSSGLIGQEDLDEMKKQGLAGFCQKPYTVVTLSRVIKNALS